MPTISLPSESSGFMTGTTNLHIGAVMCFPEDAEKRQAYIWAGHSKHLAKLEKFRGIATGGLSDFIALAYKYRFENGILSAGGFTTVERLVRDREIYGPPEAIVNRGGWVASDVLLFVLLNVETGNRDQATISKGIERFERFLAKPANKHHQMPREKSGLIKMWSNFKPVAHLWAACRVIGMEHENGVDEVSTGRLLAISEELRRRGESYVPKHCKYPVLSPDKSWKLPDGLDLPNVEVDLKTLLPPCR